MLLGSLGVKGPVFGSLGPTFGGHRAKTIFTNSRSTAIAAVTCILPIQVGQLVGWSGGQALREAIQCGSPESAATLVALGGTSGALAAAGTQRGPSDPI